MQKRGKVRSLILSPTRELAEQTLEFFQTLGRLTGLRAVSIYGGVSKSMQIQRIRSGEASTFVEPKDFGLVRSIEKAQKRSIKRKTIKNPA